MKQKVVLSAAGSVSAPSLAWKQLIEYLVSKVTKVQ